MTTSEAMERQLALLRRAGDTQGTWREALDRADQLRAEHFEAVLEAHEGGCSQRDIAGELGVKHARVQVICKEAEAARRAPARTAAEGAAG